MAQRATKLKGLLGAAQRTADQAQRSFLKAEDALAELEDREARREARDPDVESDLRERFPALGDV